MNKFITTTDILVALLRVANIVSAQKKQVYTVAGAHAHNHYANKNPFYGAYDLERFDCIGSKCDWCRQAGITGKLFIITGVKRKANSLMPFFAVHKFGHLPVVFNR
jgi:hypothetical protein